MTLAGLPDLTQRYQKLNQRKPFDVVLMFKLLILQKLHNLSDDQLEYQVNDRLSFIKFLGLSLNLKGLTKRNKIKQDETGKLRKS